MFSTVAWSSHYSGSLPSLKLQHPGMTFCVCRCAVGAITLYQDNACSAENCREGRSIVDGFTVHVSDEERFHFTSQCCQGKECNDITDALGECWQCAILPLSTWLCPSFATCGPHPLGEHLESKSFSTYLGNINSWLTIITWETHHYFHAFFFSKYRQKSQHSKLYGIRCLLVVLKFCGLRPYFKTVGLKNYCKFQRTLIYVNHKLSIYCIGNFKN